MRQITEKEQIEELKKRIEVLERKNKENAKANIWKDIKEEFGEEFDKFRWIDKWSFTNCNNKLITHEKEMNNKHEVESAIGTLIRCALRKRRITLLEEEDKEKARNITKTILEILVKESENQWKEQNL